jgi:hypothetical protein
MGLISIVIVDLVDKVRRKFIEGQTSAKSEEVD